MSFFGKLFSDKDKESNESEYLERVYESLGDESDLNPDRILDENSEVDMSAAYDPIYESVADGTEAPQNAAEGSDGGFVAPETNSHDYEKAYDFIESDGSDLSVPYAEPADDDEEPGEVYEPAACDEPENIPESGSDTQAEPEAEPVYTADFGYDEEPGAVYEPMAYDDSENEVYDPVFDSFDEKKGDTDEMDVEQLINAMQAAGGPAAREPLYEAAADSAEPDGSHAFDILDDPSSALADNNIDPESIYTAYAPKSMRPKITETSYYDLDDMEEEDSEPKKKSRVRKFVSKKKKWIIGASVAAAVVLVTVGALLFAHFRMDPLMGYTEFYATKGNIIKTMEAGGNIEPNARYNIIPLVGGTITESPLNAGDTVRAGELVYKIDDTNAQIAVQQAQNAVSRAQQEPTTGSSSDRLNIYANSSGTISGLNISSGSRINGGQIATITQANGTEIGLIPSVTGTVDRVNVSNGSSVSSGQVVATVISDNSSSSNVNSNTREMDITAANLALEQAQKELENYKIASPIDGTILVKDAKVGDSVVAGQTDQPMMVIADMSKMKFKIDVDELDIWNIELGQTVVITVSALPGETFSGEITNIAGEGEKKGNGVTVYAVEITVSDPGKIKSGMNVDAKIIIDSAINVLSLPEEALYESDGENALVITDGGNDKNAVDPADYPDINVPSGYKLIKVKYGVSDGTNVEIVSGLNIGDTVLYKAEEGSETEQDNAVSDKQDGALDDAAEKGVSDSGDNSESGGETHNFGDTEDIDNSEDYGENVESTGKAANGVLDI